MNEPGIQKHGTVRLDSGFARGACHRAALCADPLAPRPGMTINPPYGLSFFLVLRLGSNAASRQRLAKKNLDFGVDAP
jgi:hypothetical protein